MNNKPNKDYSQKYPKILVDWDEFDKLCNLHCTLEEIAGWFNCSADTIERRVKETYNETFAEHYTKRSARGKISLRRKQWQTAESGNVVMQIWLGKQWLNQSDKNEINHNPNDKPIMLAYNLDNET